ncbi:hypothetical protein Gasu2_61470 [Galdieria sulphuraria]|nr:hypothetical protein Gasu2_61470 [Galdieria sulphuraria]
MKNVKIKFNSFKILVLNLCFTGIIDFTFLLQSSHNPKCGFHKVLKYIQQHLPVREWPVVLKSLLLSHILLDEVSRRVSVYDFSLYNFGASYDTIRDAIRKKEKALFIQENEIIPSGQIVTFELMQVLKVKPTLENQEHRKKLIFAFLKIVITGYPD